MFQRLLYPPTTPRSNLLDRVGFQEPCFDKSSSIDKATFVTACENNVDVPVSEMASRDQETKPDDAKEAKEYETPTTKTLDEKPEDSQPSKGTGTEDEKSCKRSEEDDTTKDADKEKLANHGEDQNKGADKEETAKDGDDQSIADSHAVFSDGEAKTKGPGESENKLTLLRGRGANGFSLPLPLYRR
ncbi:hypothetical protein BKA83DRAFT_4351639 [Pisolithus microcarpus]|nr:hypothetical protein BKA83DRAFT_4351639 [Pisolithus microcarpus]